MNSTQLNLQRQIFQQLKNDTMSLTKTSRLMNLLQKDDHKEKSMKGNQKKIQKVFNWNFTDICYLHHQENIDKTESEQWKDSDSENSEEIEVDQRALGQQDQVEEIYQNQIKLIEAILK